MAGKKVITGLTAVALVPSLAGIYAVLSYTVARRTREIGLRVALGASARSGAGRIGVGNDVRVSRRDIPA